MPQNNIPLQRLRRLRLRTWRRPTAETWSQNGQEILDKKLKKAIKSQNLEHQ
jgi:hypothetical protein